VVNTWLQTRKSARVRAADPQNHAINGGISASINPSSNRSNFRKIPAAFSLNVPKNSNEVFKRVC
jgi:hypothetical protein